VPAELRFPGLAVVSDTALADRLVRRRGLPDPASAAMIMAVRPF
jgi:hypothetical protein